MCRMLGVSPSGYYAWTCRGPSARSQADAALTGRIKRIHEESRETHGVPRIHFDLREQGVRVGRKRVARLMKAAGLQGISRRKWTRTTVRCPGASAAPDLVDRDFTAPGAGSTLGGRHHLNPDLDRVPVSGRGPRRLEPQSGRLGDGDASED